MICMLLSISLLFFNSDVIYIGSIHPFHLPLAKEALAAGKPVLCEKPLCMNARETMELIAYAKARNLFLMEAVWVRHFPIYEKLRQMLDDKIVGDVKNVIMSFGIPIGEKDRYDFLSDYNKKLKHILGYQIVLLLYYAIQVTKCSALLCK